MYVAMTRARRRLYISFAQSRMLHGQTRYHIASRFLDEIPQILARFADCDLLLYQAGADPHVNDPLGGWLTTAQLRERDRHVFAATRRMGLPIAWNLAGGYQTNLRKVLDIHDNTMLECLSAFAEDEGALV
jgi:acetoin utilization deacetylase AcuC-like enzyme